MKVFELIDKLKDYAPEKEVFLIKECKNEDITCADAIDKVEQRTLARDDFEYTEFVAVVLIHKIL